MFRKVRWSSLVASTLACIVASTTLADDVFVQQGVVVKPLSKRKQRKLEKKMQRRSGSEVVVEGTPTATPSPDAIAGMKARRSFRPLFADRSPRRTDVVVAPAAGASSGVVVSNPRVVNAPGDPLVIPGSAEMMPTPRTTRPPIMSTPRGGALPLEPLEEPEAGSERPASARILPAPADEIPPPVVSIPRKPAPMPPPTTPAPVPVPVPTPMPAPESPAPSVDPGATPPPAPEAVPTAEPALERPLDPKPA